MTPYPVGTIVRYHGSLSGTGRELYVISEHQPPRPGVHEPDVNYPDGVAYVIWPLGVPQSWANRYLSVVQVRRGSITPV